jgi:hypothetical protein
MRGAEPLPIGAAKWVAVDEVTTVSVQAMQNRRAAAVVLRRHGPPSARRDAVGTPLLVLSPSQAAELARVLELVCHTLTVRSR